MNVKELLQQEQPNSDYGFNAEFDDFGNPNGVNVEKMEFIHNQQMDRYRNWSEVRKEGGTFCQTRLCVMPLTLSIGGKVYAAPHIEFSAEDNDFTGGYSTVTNTKTGEQREVKNHDGYDNDTLLDRLNGLLGDAPEGITVRVKESPKHYYNVNLECEADQLDDLFAYIDEIDARFKGEYSDLEKSHEWIG